MLSQALSIAYYRPATLELALTEFLGAGNYRIVQVDLHAEFSKC